MLYVTFGPAFNANVHNNDTYFKIGKNILEKELTVLVQFTEMTPL